MVAFNFKPYFAPDVESGKKTRSIRTSKKCNVGDAIQLYRGNAPNSAANLVMPFAQWLIMFACVKITSRLATNQSTLKRQMILQDWTDLKITKKCINGSKMSMANQYSRDMSTYG